MIENYTAYSANERTFLAWVRTSISIVGFGILIDHLDPGGAGPNTSAVTLALVVLGALLIIFSAIRFLALNQRIHSKQEERPFLWRFDIMFVVMNITLVLLLAAFLIHVM